MFDKLFEGRKSAYGTYTLPKGIKKKTTKQKGTAQTVKKKITNDLYEKHLNGEQGLGIVPIMEDNNCVFGAIDIDVYDLNHRDLEKQIQNYKLPLIVCTTKSGGAHLYCFFKEPINAADVQPALKSWAQRLGFPDTEIFPKQKKLKKTDIGNWINLPYFNAKTTDRYAIKNGNKLELADFLMYAQHKSISKDQLQELTAIDSIFPDGPPCLNQIASIGIGEGERNTSLFNVAVYYKKAKPDNWEDALEQYNDSIQDPLPSKELAEIIRQLGKDKYFYQCEQVPLCTHCDKATCATMKYGVGKAAKESREVSLNRISKVETDPPIWLLDVDEVTLTLSTEQLTEQPKFIKACVEQLNKMPKRLKDWASVIDNLLEDVVIIPAPPDAGIKGQITMLVEEYLDLHRNAETMSDIMHGIPFYNDGKIAFRSNDLLDYINKRSNIKIKANEIYTRLRSLGVESRKVQIAGYAGRFNIWFMDYQPAEITEDEEF